MKKQLRMVGDAFVGVMPSSLLRMFFKTFETRQELAEAPASTSCRAVLIHP